MSESLRIAIDAESIAIFGEDEELPLVVQNAVADQRPFIHPLLVPGRSVSLTENAPPHHAWQHGLYIGLNDVNGVGFWTEGLHAETAHLDGTFHPRIVGNPVAERDGATWTVVTEYRDPGGLPLLEETQDWSFHDADEHYELNLTWTLAARDDLTFGQHPYGGLFLRAPFRAESGGSAVNSAGQQWKNAEGQPAEWVSVCLPIEGEDATVVIMDHPSNVGHPVGWRVDNDLGICPSPSIAGAWQLAAGDERTFRYRVIAYRGAVDVATIEQAWATHREEES